MHGPPTAIYLARMRSSIADFRFQIEIREERLARVDPHDDVIKPAVEDGAD
jgi:hypothetical protein